jgi:GntR family transcriptional regulator, transcriptional repressor for pyruvate dehydrogenase complex
MSKNTALFGALELRRHKLTEQIAEIIQEMVNSQKLKVGDSLPPERELADLFKVNRTTVREAIHLLRDRGLVERKNRQGTRIVAIPPASVGAAIERYVILKDCRQWHLYEVRLVLEPKAAALAATNAEPEDLHNLEATLSRLEESWVSEDVQRTASADAAFHLALANSSHNPMIVAIFAGFSPVMERFLLLQYRILKRSDESFQMHREVYEAVAARDPVRAAYAMQRHMTSSPALNLRLSESAAGSAAFDRPDQCKAVGGESTVLVESPDSRKSSVPSGSIPDPEERAIDRRNLMNVLR